MKGIYKIVNTKNGKLYIGSSTKIRRRWNTHKRLLRLGKHHSVPLQRAYDKYGKDSFDFILLERLAEDATSEEMYKREQYYLDTLKPFDRKGYNLVREAGGGKAGTQHSEETRKKIRTALKGRAFSTNHKKRLKEAWKRRPPVSSETRQRMSEARKGRKAWNKGIPQTEDHKKKISDALKGRPSHWRGKTFSEEHKRKLSESRSGEGNPKSVLTWDLVREIRELYNNGVSQRKIAKQFGVSRGCIQGITTNKTWREDE
jgi:group I intron endonuclease